MTVPERAVGDCHPRQTVWLRADEPRACGSPPPYDLAGDSRVPVVLHGFEGIKKRPSRTVYCNRIVAVPGIAIGEDGSDMKAGYAATFASEAGMAIRANPVRGAACPIPRHTRVAGSPAGIVPSVRWYKKTPSTGGCDSEEGFGSNAPARPVGSNTGALHQPCDATVGAVPEGKPMLTSILPRGPDLAPTAWVGIGMPSRICLSHLRGGMKRHPSPDGGIAARERAATVPHQGMADACTGRDGIQNSERTGRPNDLWSASYLTRCE